MFTDLSWQALAGETMGLVALALCLAAFADKRDERLIALLLFANIGFAAQFLLFENWVAGWITVLIVGRMWLVRHYKGDVRVMSALLVATLAIAWLTWSGPWDLAPLTAGLVGTIGMFMLRGVPMRLCLAVGAALWVVTNVVNGSVGAIVAEALILATNLWTIARMAIDNRRAARTG